MNRRWWGDDVYNGMLRGDVLRRGRLPANFVEVRFQLWLEVGRLRAGRFPIQSPRKPSFEFLDPPEASRESIRDADSRIEFALAGAYLILIGDIAPLERLWFRTGMLIAVTVAIAVVPLTAPLRRASDPRSCKSGLHLVAIATPL